MNRVSRRSHFIIIAGADRCGTTSWFKYLGDHPDVCASVLKETRFFLDSDFPMHARYGLSDGIERYFSYFDVCSTQRFLLESSPQYLYSPGSASRIARTLPNAHLLFSLRDPIDRLISIYRHDRRIGRITADLSLSDWLEIQMSALERGVLLPEYHMRAVVHGEYSRYLSAFFDVFPRERLHIFSFEDLVDSPRDALSRLFGQLGLDDAAYEEVAFEAHNASAAVRWSRAHASLMRWRATASRKLAALPALRWRLGRGFRALFGWYLKGQGRVEPKIEIDPPIRLRLVDLYANEPMALRRLTDEQELGQAWLQTTGDLE